MNAKMTIDFTNLGTHQRTDPTIMQLLLLETLLIFNIQNNC